MHFGDCLHKRKLSAPCLGSASSIAEENASASEESPPWQVGVKKVLQSQALQAESLDPSSPLTEDSPNSPRGSSVALGRRSRSGISTFCSASELPHVGPFQGDLIRV